MPGAELVGVADTRSQRGAEVARQFGVPAYQDYRRLISQVEAVVVAVPTAQHFAVASAFLAAGKSVLVEKPLTANLNHADRLVQLANDQGLVLQVGHIERFNPVLHALPNRTELPRLIEARRIGPYSFRSTDIGAVFDLMIHDVDIVLWLLKGSPQTVQALAWNVFGGCEDVAAAQLTFAGGTVVRLTASRADFTQHREMTIWWSDSVARLDFANKRTLTAYPAEAFTHARSRFANANPEEISPLRQGLNDGKYFDVTETDWTAAPDQLTQELEEFLTCVRTGAKPRVSGEQGREAVAVAVAVLRAVSEQPSFRVAA